MTFLHPISQLSKDTAKKIQFVFSDIDDTISSHGKILPEAFKAIWDLHYQGIHVIPITGRCAGWVDHIARMWPVDAVVGENGALYAYIDFQTFPAKLKMVFYEETNSLPKYRRKLELIKEEIFTKIPSVGLASDQSYRLFDLAIDFCEDVPPHTKEQIKEIVEIFQKHGAQTKVSSIHVNGWFGTYDKLKMTKKMFREHFKMELEDHLEKTVFIGDSPNDQPMFDFFPNSVGVANVKNFLPDLSSFPRYITKNEGGLGFSEMVKILLKHREQ